MNAHETAAQKRTSFPAIYVRITEVVDGFTATVWLRESPGQQGMTLLTDEAVKSVNEAQALAARHAKEHGISADGIDEDITIHRLKPPKRDRH